MKTIAFFSLAAAISAIPAFASLEKFEEVTCHSAYVADAGYSVLIERALDGSLLARVAEVSFLGTRDLGQTQVERYGTAKELVYSAYDLKLAIDLSGDLGDHFYRAKLEGEMITQHDFTDMICNVKMFRPVAPILPKTGRHGGLSCMAYWTGYVFDAETRRCERRGASGCGNPFQYREIKDCESAYSLKLPN